jgi:hypothetical protein
MKTLKLLSIIILLSAKGFAQSVTLEPNVFRLASSNGGNCPSGHEGKIQYDTQTNRMIYCTGVSTSESASSHWIGNSSIYYNGKIVIRNNNPTVELDVNGSMLANNLYVADKVGIATQTPTEKFEVLNQPIQIRSSTDISNTYRFRYLDASDRLDIVEGGSTRMFVQNGGNVTIGATTGTNKLHVAGTGSFADNVVANGGSVMQNTSATQLKMITVTATTPTGTFTVFAGGCDSIGFSFPSSTFNTAPAVFIGQKISGSTLDNQLVMTVENVTTTGGRLKFCNNTTSHTSILNYSYSLIAVGN